MKLLQVLNLLLPLLVVVTAQSGRDYGFHGCIPETVLHNYLSRSIHYTGISAGSPGGESAFFEDDLRVILKTGAKYISRAAFAWDVPDDDEVHFELAEQRAKKIHEQDPEIILQADIFETVYSAKSSEASERDFSPNGVENILVPDFVFREFGLSPEKRTFRYEDMIYKCGLWRNRWAPGASVPDITQQETKMWVFYRAKRYINAGYESIQLGQIQLFAQNDPDYTHMAEIISRIRRYGRSHARRKYILISGHVSLDSDHNILREGKLLIDFLPFPLRMKSIPDSPLQTCLEMGYIDSVYDKKISGIHPSGWKCDQLPMLLEFDNYYNALTNPGSVFPWGTDEITWFANQAKEYRDRFLKYAWDWIWKHVPNSYLSMPGRRVTRVPVFEMKDPDYWEYYCNNKSDLCPKGFGQEDTIGQIWSNPNYQDNLNRLIIPLRAAETAPGITIGDLDEDMPIDKLRLMYIIYGGFSSHEEREKARILLSNQGWKRDEVLKQDEMYKREAELLRK